MSAPARALAIAALLASGCHQEALVAKLRYDAVPRAPEEAFRAHAPDSSPVPLTITLPWRETLLENGVRVVLLERHDLPIVSIQLVIARGSSDADAPEDTYGVFTGLLGAGSAQRTAQELRALWAPLGTSPAVWAGASGSGLGVRVAASDLSEAISLLAQPVVHPRLSAEDFVAARKRWRDGFDSNTANAAIFARASRTLLFGHRAPYGFEKPSAAHTESIGLADVTSLFAKLLQPVHTILVVVGDATPDAVNASVAVALKDWTSSAEPLPIAAPPPPTEPGPHTAIIRWDNLERTFVGVLARIGPVPREELAAIEVFGRALSGTSSTLHREVRDDLGAAYSFGPWISATRSTTTLGFGGSLEGARAAVTLRTTIDAIRGARAGALDDAAVERGRSSLLADYRVRASTNEGLASMAVTAMLKGEPLANIASYPARVDAIDGAAAKAVATRYLTDEALRVIVLGNTKAMGEFLTFAPVAWWNNFAEVQ